MGIRMAPLTFSWRVLGAVDRRKMNFYGDGSRLLTSCSIYSQGQALFSLHNKRPAIWERPPSPLGSVNYPTDML